MRFVKLLAMIILATVSVHAQGNGGKSGFGGTAGFGGGATASSTVAYDAIASNITGANPSYSISITIGTGLTNQALALFSATNDSGSAHLTGVTGPSGASWAAVGTQQTGNGVYKGECWIGKGFTASGSQSITLTFNTAPSVAAYGIITSLQGVNQTTPAGSTCGSVTSGALSVTIAANDLAVFASFDGTNNRTVTGCTSSTDLSTFGATGLTAAHCNSAPTSSLTFSGYGASSVALGFDVKHN